MPSFRDMVRRTYVPDTVRATPLEGPPNAYCQPHVTTDQFVVSAIDHGNYGTRATSFPTYASGQSSFEYEIPDNVCLPPGVTYPASNSYFPGRQGYPYRLDPKHGMLYRPGCGISWCPEKFWNQGARTLPHVPIGHGPSFTRDPANDGGTGPLVTGANILNSSSIISDIHNSNKTFGYPLGGNSSIQEFDPEYGGGGGGGEGSAVGAGSPSEPPGPPVVGLGISPVVQEELSDGGQQVDLISPGGQDTWYHRGVKDNRYTGQQRKSNVYIHEEPHGVEPYSNSLYQTPYDTTKNVVSTGTMLNTYTGEMYETFENQLPPPNTTKGALPDYQLKQPNPRLLYAMGGFNHHNPPPRKSEQPGYVFNPVSARGGSNPWGDALYAPKIQARVQDQVIRSIYNNRDGDQVVEPSMVGEKPKGFFGLVPRYRYVPYLNPTNELDQCGTYVTIPENQNTDLRKREQYTGAFYNRKDKVLVHRDPYPTTFVNGVEAISWLPITTDHSGPMRADFEQNYIPVGDFDRGQTLGPTGLNKTRLREGQTEQTPGPAAAPGVGDLVQGHFENRSTGQGLAEGSLPQGPSSAGHSGDLVVGGTKQLRQTDKIVYTRPQALPDMHSSVAGTLILPKTHQLRSTQKATLDNLRPASGLRDMPNVGIIMSDKQLRSTQKATLAQMPVGPTAQGTTLGSTIMSEQQLRETLKTSMADNPFRSAAGPGLETAGDLILADKDLRDSLKDAIASGAFPIGSAMSHTPAAYVVVDRTVREPECRTKQGEQSYYMGVSAEDIGAQSSVLPGEFQTTQHRGTCDQLYMPSVSMIPSAANGLSTRVVQPLREPGCRSKTEDPYRHSLPDMPDIPGGNRSLFPSIRTTQRSEQDTCDYIAAMEDG